MTVDAVREALETVEDPHVPVSLRRMGMLRDIAIDDGGVVQVQLCIPCLGCPGVTLLREAIEQCVTALPGVSRVVVDAGFFLPWSRDMVDAEAKALMRTSGIQI